MKTTRHNIIVAIVFIIGILSAVTLAAAVPPPSDYDTDRIVDAIRQVETGGCKNPSAATGDDGKAIGPFQIWESYWHDALEYDPSIGGEYSDCRDEAYARRIVIAYLSRYVKHWDDETVARTHNGGGSILKKKKDSKAWKNTTKYWQKVQKQLN
jgi:hypothetical protein